jgi:hypothetical protein
MRWTILLALVASACATTAPVLEDPPLAMQVEVTGLKEAEQELLEEQLCAVEGVSGCERAHDKGKTTYTFTYKGSLGSLRYQVSQFPHPGLEVEGASSLLKYGGFDNLAPKIEPLEPNPEEVLTVKRVTFAVRVPDKDVAEVTIGGDKADQDGDEWIKTLELAEGTVEVPVVAKDKDGNERELYMAATVDTMPPDLIVELTPKEGEEDTFIVSGKLEAGAKIKVNGKDVAVGMFGDWSAEVRYDPDRRTVVIVAIDEHGNEVSQERELRTGKVLD